MNWRHRATGMTCCVRLAHTQKDGLQGRGIHAAQGAGRGSIDAFSRHEMPGAGAGTRPVARLGGGGHSAVDFSSCGAAIGLGRKFKLYGAQMKCGAAGRAPRSPPRRAPASGREESCMKCAAACPWGGVRLVHGGALAPCLFGGPARREPARRCSLAVAEAAGCCAAVRARRGGSRPRKGARGSRPPCWCGAVQKWGGENWLALTCRAALRRNGGGAPCGFRGAGAVPGGRTLRSGRVPRVREGGAEGEEHQQMGAAGTRAQRGGGRPRRGNGARGAAGARGEQYPEPSALQAGHERGSEKQTKEGGRAGGGGARRAPPPLPPPGCNRLYWPV